MTTDNQPKTDRDILTRYAAVVPVLVEAGCEGPPPWCDWREGCIEEIRNPSCGVINDDATIAALEQWFHQTVVPWCVHVVHPPRYNKDKRIWHWSIHPVGRWAIVQADPDPTEANIQCIEALAKVIGGKR